MRGGGEAERLRLRVLVRMEARVNLAITDDHCGEQQPEQEGAHADGSCQADRFNHDVTESGDLVCLDDFHYDGRAWRLHALIVLQP